MKLKTGLLVILTFMSVVRTDDYFLDEEEEKISDTESTGSDNGQFMRDFACMVGANKHTSGSQQDYAVYKDHPSFNLNFRRLRINLFKQCILEITDDIISQVSRAKSSDEINQIHYPFFDYFDHKEIFESEAQSLSEDEKVFGKQLKNIETKIKELQKKHKRENPEKSEDTEELDSDNANSSGTSIFFIGIDHPVILGVTAAAIVAIIGIVFLVWNKLFKGESLNKKKQKKEWKRNMQMQLQHEHATKPLPKTFFKQPIQQRYQKR